MGLHNNSQNQQQQVATEQTSSEDHTRNLLDEVNLEDLIEGLGDLDDETLTEIGALLEDLDSIE